MLMLAQVISNLVHIRKNAAILDELDVAQSSATFAKEQRLVRPIVTSGFVDPIHLTAI